MADNPPEAALLDEPTTADLAAKVAEAWRDFARALSGAIPDLPAGTRLDITLDPTASGTGEAVYGIELRTGDDGALGAFAVSNAALPEGYRLSRGAVAELVALGWAPPRVVTDSGDRFGLSGTVSDATRVAVLVSRTFRDVYGAPHPAFLTYSVNGADGDERPDAPITALGAARLLSGAEDATRGADLAVWSPEDEDDEDADASLETRVQVVVAHLMRTTPEALQVDSDGDIGIRSGSAMVFVRVRDNPPLVDVLSPLLTEVTPTEQLYVRLSELTNRMPIGRLYCVGGTVWASVPVFGRDFQATHLTLAVQVMTGLADELDDRLQNEFGGKRFFGETERPDGQERTGMYL